MRGPERRFNWKPDSLVGKIIVGVVITAIAGGSAPWWWTVIFPKPVAKKIPPECSPEILRDQLFRAGSEKGAVIKSTARTMREKFRLQDFECVSALTMVFLENDPDNGHGLYFAGEVWRVKAKQNPKHSDLCRDRMREHFFRYLGNESALPSNERDGDGKLCYEREKGYCAERTAWINHLMAIDYFQQAEDSKDNETKIKRLERAAKFLKIDLAFGGFDQITPSAVLRDKIEEELLGLGSSYPTDL
jgi:hypothetical protein